MRRLLIWVPVLVIAVAALTMLQPSAPSFADVPTATSTPGIYFPMIFSQPTNTPTPTPTVTHTPTATATPSATFGAPPPQPMSGNLRREDPNKPSYATNIEDIWHWYWIHNANASRVYFGILGVNVFKDAGYNFFHTSWSAEGAPNGVLSIDGGCFGLNGYNCSPDGASAQLRDKVIVSQPGHYDMTLAICQSTFSACSQPGGAWQNLSSVSFDAIDWTPMPPSQFEATPGPEEQCRLVTDDPRGTYLKCTKGKMKHRSAVH